MKRCDICARLFNSFDALKKHMMATHARLKMQQQAVLLNNRTIAEMPYMCSIENCRFASSLFDDVLFHHKTVKKQQKASTNESFFQVHSAQICTLCPVCLRTFICSPEAPTPTRELKEEAARLVQERLLKHMQQHARTPGKKHSKTLCRSHIHSQSPPSLNAGAVNCSSPVPVLKWSTCVGTVC